MSWQCRSRVLLSHHWSSFLPCGSLWYAAEVVSAPGIQPRQLVIYPRRDSDGSNPGCPKTPSPAIIRGKLVVWMYAPATRTASLNGRTLVYPSRNSFQSESLDSCRMRASAASFRGSPLTSTISTLASRTIGTTRPTVPRTHRGSLRRSAPRRPWAGRP